MSRPDPFDWTYESPRVSVEPADDPWKLDFADLEGEPLHLRNYAVRAYRRSATEFLLRGVVDDRKRASNWIPSDSSMMVMHHMVIDLVIEYPTLTILKADVTFEAHPNDICFHIEDRYHLLEGVSIARGFTHKVREMFGGPRGCTHVTALLQAMAPVAVQSIWGMGAANRREAAVAAGVDLSKQAPPPPSEEEQRTGSMYSLNSCHVWDEQGEVMEQIRSGVELPLPLPIRRRMAKHGLDHDIVL